MSAAAPPRPRRRMSAARRRAVILRAFREEALRCGSLAGVGIRAVVERAGCTAPVLYRLFGDRAGLVREAVRSTHLPLIERLEALGAERDGPADRRIERLARAFLGREPGDEEAFEALVNVECRADPELAQRVREIFGRFEALLVRVIAEGVAGGVFRADADPAYVAWRLIDLGLFRNQMHLMGLEGPRRIGYPERALASLLEEIAA